MAQPPEAAPLRPQSSRDSAPAQPRVQPTNLDALVEQTHPRDQNQQPHLPQHKQQLQEQHPHYHQHQYQQQNQHYQPQQAPSGTHPPGAPQYSDATSNSNSSVAHSNGSRGRRSPSITDEKSKADGTLPVDANPDNHASVARSIDPASGAHSPLNDTQHNGGATGPAARPDMSNTQPGPGPARQPATYASPPTYPQAGMSPVSHYMYSSQPIPSDPYRPSPTTLPSMRTLDHRQPQAQPQHGIPMGAHIETEPSNAGTRFRAYGLLWRPPIPHCDEAHPTCNNCKKSKRECLGYDPIFKPQQGPAAIQPAPSTQPPAPPPASVPAPAVPSSGPHPYQTSYPPPLPSNIIPEPAPSTAPQIIKTEPSYDYSTAIDPALQGSDISGTRAPRYHQEQHGYRHGPKELDMISSGHLESSVVWALACLPLSIPFTPRQQHPEPAPAEDELGEVRGRLQVFEALLSGETLAVNPLSPPPTSNVHPLRRNELEFWYHLAQYLLQENASSSPAGVSSREHSLGVMRDLLDGRENRDVLYSIAVLREYTAHWDASYSEQNVPSHLEESDSRSKLAVATRFIRDESNVTGGTTNVVRRFAQLAYSAFVRPGANVNRKNNRK
ncbi:hypothetical protein CHGG_05043 [Chaetomium globosum CBS 148.51]|uniref:Zn(2)-C6 fungal-type domain-containing protein n=1 Tax=Chaetomium globosum (strain ATCC 6205 / CBS 148.51 / DSM 1962 / NBRC 6347 / NRRL 1970) TaxID=306901 RepID=Q2GZK3_CHAGB|nr:uncharacterized protein CHGG_05043 [Chaetomium globosum CBS 148.51]EAQ88424.1 hypothetical protein CHGG_05043 [Chaetomium globosum CBS 148.51]